MCQICSVGQRNTQRHEYRSRANSKAIRLSEVHKKTGADFVSNSIVGRNLGTQQKVPSQVPPHNAIVDKFGTILLLNFGKANSDRLSCGKK